MSEFSKKDSCIVETGSSVFYYFYRVFGSFPVSVDIYILVKYNDNFAGYIKMHKLCLCGIALV